MCTCFCPTCTTAACGRLCFHCNSLRPHVGHAASVADKKRAWEAAAKLPMCSTSVVLLALACGFHITAIQLVQLIQKRHVHATVTYMQCMHTQRTLYARHAEVCCLEKAQPVTADLSERTGCDSLSATCLRHRQVHARGDMQSVYRYVHQTYRHTMCAA